MIAIVMIGLLFMIAFGLGLYFFVFAKKNCTKITEEDECTEPCQWDTYGDKCIGEKDTLTAAPTPTPTGCSTYTTQDTCLSPCEWDSSMSVCGSPITPSGGGSSLSVRDKKKMQCLAGRYHEAYKKYKAGGLDAVKSYYDEFGKSKGLNTDCNLSDYEAVCYTLQNPEVYNAFQYDRAKLRKHYDEYGRDKVARFNCRGGKFIGSDLPEDSTLIYQGGIGLHNTPNNLYYLNQQGDGNLVWVKRGTGTQWSLGSHVCGNGTTATLQGDGNICVYGANNCAKCTMSNSPSAKGHVIVAKDDGKLYVDHGDGESGRSYIYEP